MKTKITLKNIDELIKRQGGSLCGYCGCEIIPGGKVHPRLAVADHIVPRSRGGSNAISNLVLICFSCNSKKATKSLDEFRWWMSMQEFCTRTGVRFTIDQVAYLDSIGVQLDIRDYRFPFEAGTDE